MALKVLVDLDFEDNEIHNANLDYSFVGISRASHDEWILNGDNFPGNYIIWTDDGKTQKIREYIWTYVDFQLTQFDTKYYDEDGILVKTVTETPNYNGSDFPATSTRTVA